MSETKKGFRREKKPTKREMEKQLAEKDQALNGQMQQVQMVMQMFQQQLQQVMMGTQQIGQQAQALANLTRLRVADEAETVVNGDTILMDFVGVIKETGKLFNGSSMLGSTIEVGSGSLIPGFEEGVVGMKAGEVKDIELTFPENYQVEDLRGKETIFTVQIVKVLKKLEGRDVVLNKIEELEAAEKAEALAKAEEAAEQKAETPQGA